MRNYAKLKEKLYNDVDEVKRGTDNFKKIAVEAKKISDIARDGNIDKICKLNQKNNLYT